MPSDLHPLLSNPVSVAAALVPAILALAALLSRRQKPWLGRIRRKPLLTPNEAEFFHRLQRALPGYHVVPQVSFAALITDDGQLSGEIAGWSETASTARLPISSSASAAPSTWSR
jgi:hypothetical protein